MNCDKCDHYRWYYDYCEKWRCNMDWRGVHDCFQPKSPIMNTMDGERKCKSRV